MSASNGSHHVGKGDVTFTFDDGRSLTVGLVAETRTFNRMARDYQEKGADRWQLLEDYGKGLKERHGIDLGIDEVDGLVDALNAAYDAKKKSPTSATGPATPTSPPTTA